MARRKSNNNFMADEPREGWAFFEQTNTWRRTPSPSGASPEYFPKEWGDWVAVSRPKDWLPDENTRLNLGSSLHAAPNMAGVAGGGTSGGMKIGAGNKPQPYGWHGYYGETGGGISGGHEVRGKVTPPVQTGKAAPAPQPEPLPAAVTWKHPEEGNGLKPQMRETVEDLRNVPEVESVFISSGHRSPLTSGDPHADGRAVDVSRINGFSVESLWNAPGAEAEKARRAAENMVEQAKKDPNVNQVLGPTGCWEKVDGDWKRIKPGTARNDELIRGHLDHYHINVFRK